MNSLEYPCVMRPLSPEEGGGWLITFPDLPGCMSDGETPEEALQCWIEACGAVGREIPSPGESSADKLLKPLQAVPQRLGRLGLWLSWSNPAQLSPVNERSSSPKPWECQIAQSAQNRTLDS